MQATDRHRPETLIASLVAALRLDPQLYDSVSRDAAATRHALLVVLLSGIANGFAMGNRFGTLAVFIGMATAVAGWLLWSATIALVARLFRCRTRADHSLLRALGFANAPGVFLVLGVVPVAGALVRLLVVIWLLAATAVAVQPVFGVGRRRGIAIAIVAFVLYAAIGVWLAQVAAT